MKLTRINQLCAARGITTAYQLQKLLAVHPTVAARWFNDELESIDLTTVRRLCVFFECEPNDLFDLGDLSKSAQA